MRRTWRATGTVLDFVEAEPEQFAGSFDGCTALNLKSSRVQVFMFDPWGKK